MQSDYSPHLRPERQGVRRHNAELDVFAAGRSIFTVEDRIGSGSQLDIFQPNCTATIDYGCRSERVRVIDHVAS